MISNERILNFKHKFLFFIHNKINSSDGSVKSFVNRLGIFKNKKNLAIKEFTIVKDPENTEYKIDIL